MCTRERIIVIERKTLKFSTNECIFFWNGWQLTRNNVRETDVWMPLLHNGHHLYSNSNAGLFRSLSFTLSFRPLWHILAVDSQCKIINSGLFICVYCMHVCTSGPHCVMEVESTDTYTFYILHCTRCVRSIDTIFKSSSNVGLMQTHSISVFFSNPFFRTHFDPT